MIFSPSLEILFRGDEWPFAQRMKAVRELGFTSYEFWSWTNKDMNEIAELQQSLGLQVGSFCTKNNNLVDSSKRDEFLQGLELSIVEANKLDCQFLIVTTGNVMQGVSRANQQESIIEGLRASAPIVEEAGVMLVLEPLNTLIDHQGYYLNTSEEAVHIVKEVGSDNVKVLYDIYHQQITEGNLITNITNYYDYIGYFHLADHPGRQEPGTGEINYTNVLSAIKQLGYKGYMGMEYKTTDPVESLKKFMATYTYT